MLEILDSVASGGILGLIGSLFGKGFHIFEMKEAAKEKIAEREHELKLLEIESKRKVAEMEIEERIAANNVSSSVQEASYTHDTDSGPASQWVINILRLVRPGITVMTLFLSTAMIYTQSATIYRIDPEMVEQMFGLTTLCVTWWFGSRSIEKKI